MFSPVLNSSLIAVAGSEGTRILDDRRIGTNCRFFPMLYCHFCAEELKCNFLYSLLRFVCWSSDSTTTTYSARFDVKGSRLLCMSGGGHPIVYNTQSANAARENVQLSAPGYSVGSYGRSNSCFAGDDDELVVAPSATDNNLFIWSVPEGRGDRTIDQSLLSLTGHQHHLNQVRYCKATSTVASGDAGGVIKLWTPSTPAVDSVRLFNR